MKPQLTRTQKATIVGGISLIVTLLVVLQLWLLTPTMNAWMGGDHSVVWPALVASLGCFLVNLWLLRRVIYLQGGCHRTRRSESDRPRRPRPAAEHFCDRDGDGHRFARCGRRGLPPHCARAVLAERRPLRRAFTALHPPGPAPPRCPCRRPQEPRQG